MAPIFGKSKVHVKNFINNEFVDEEDRIEVHEPATGEVWATCPRSSVTAADLAVKAAHQALPAWAATSVEVRSRLMNRIADALEHKLEEFAQAESRDTGKPLSVTRVMDIPRAAAMLRFYGSNFMSYVGQSREQPEFEVVSFTLTEPVGVSVILSPWNMPLYLLCFQFSPAIAAGCTVVLKPSELTPVTAWMLCDIIQSILPPGVVNIVFGDSAKPGESLVAHPDVKAVSFTGSCANGKKIMAACSATTKKVMLEMGGKNSAIVFEDANFEKAVQECVRSAFANQGQMCLAISRFYVQQPIYEKFVEAFKRAAGKLSIGAPGHAETKLGPLISKGHLNHVRSYVQKAKSENVSVYETNMPELPTENKNGYYISPTIITNISDDTPSMKHEIFGPVACIVPFETEDEAVRRANDTEYGLVACVWSSSAGCLQRMAKRLHVGTVWCNCWLVRDLTMPFGGVKQSGLGREGYDSYDFFTEKKVVFLKALND